MKPIIYICIPVHNRKLFLKDCLESIYCQTFNDYKILVVDDGSTDGTSKILTDYFPEVEILKGDGGLWWTGAINVAVKKAISYSKNNDYILVLNDDLIVDKNYLGNLLNCAKENKNSIVGSVVTDINNRDFIYSGGVKINWWTAKFSKLNFGKSLSSFPAGHIENVSTLTGRGVLFPVAVFNKIGIYNNSHYKQCGDTELPVRAKKNGFNLIVCYDAPVYSITKDPGHINHLDKFSINVLNKYFFDIKSNTNIKYRFWYAMDASRHPIQGLIFFIFDFARISFHFLKLLKLNNETNKTKSSISNS